jgi:uncharacterized protein
MLINRDYVGHMAAEILKKLAEGNLVEFKNLPAVTQHVRQAMMDEITIEDRISDEAREILIQHQDAMRSTEKIVRLSHKIMDVLVASDDVEFIEDRDTIRQQIVNLVTATLRDEEKADAEVRKKITSQKKEILEGSEEWDVLYRKYYSEEMRRMGVQTAPEEQQRRR